MTCVPNVCMPKPKGCVPVRTTPAARADSRERDRRDNSRQLVF
jgi:hypothetical protein